MNRGFLAGLSAAVFALSTSTPAMATSHEPQFVGTIFEDPGSEFSNSSGGSLLARSADAAEFRHAAHGSHSSHSSHASHASHASHFSSTGSGTSSGLGVGVGGGGNGNSSSTWTPPPTATPTPTPTPTVVPTVRCAKPMLQGFPGGSTLDIFITNWSSAFSYTATSSAGKARLTGGEILISGLKRKTSVKVTVTASAPKCLPNSASITLKTK